jgi:serine/threonine-protein kinase RIO1
MTQQLNGYKAFYKGKTAEVYAETSFKAQEAAAKIFRAKKSYEVTVVLCEKAGEQVVHAPMF